MKVVVTGGSGKLGRVLVEHLAEHGHEVVSLDRQRPERRGSAWHHTVDLTHTEELWDVLMHVRPEAVCHLAANPNPYGQPRHAQLMGNVGMTHAVLQACADLEVRRVAVASSEMANGWSSVRRCPARLPFAEEDETATPNAYAMSKRLGESIAEGIAASRPEMGIASLRVNLVTAPEMEWIHRLIRRVPGNHANLWGYQDARDAALAFRLWIESERTGHRVYLLAADDALTDRPIREAVRDHFGPEPAVPETVGEFGSLVCSARIRQELGWSPVHSWREYEALPKCPDAN